VDILTWTQWIEFWLGPTFFGTGTTYIKNSKGSGWASVLLGGLNSSLATTWPKNDTPAPRQVCGFGKLKSTFGHFVIEFQNLVIVAETSSDRDEQTCGSARCISMIVALTVKSRCWMLVSVAGNHVKPLNLHFGCYPRVDSGQSVHDPPFRWLKANGFPANFPWYQPPQRWTSWILLKILVTFLSFSGLLGKTNPWCQKSQKSSSGHWFSREHHRMGGALIWWRIINLWISWDTLGYHEGQLGL
jgi:hypothetical protein